MKNSERITVLQKTLESKNHIYKGKYEGWYSTSDEAFLTKDQITDSTDEHGNKIKVDRDCFLSFITLI